MRTQTSQKMSLGKRLKTGIEVAEGCFATLFGGLLLFSVHLVGSLPLGWAFHSSSQTHSITLRAVAFLAGIFNLLVLAGNIVMFRWMRFVMDDASEPLPFQVIPYLNAESRWIRRLIPLACLCDIGVLWLMLFSFEMLFSRDVEGTTGAIALISFQIALCFISNSFIVFFLQGVGARESVLRKFWARRFLFDVCASFVIWGGMQLVPDYGANVRT